LNIFHSYQEDDMATMHGGRKLMGTRVTALVGIACLVIGLRAVAQQPDMAAQSSENQSPQKMIVALTKIPTTVVGKASKAQVKKPLITVTGPTSVTIVSMSLFGAGTRVEQNEKGEAVLASQAELGLAIMDSSGEYRIEADKRTKIAAELVNQDFVITDKGRMVLYITPGIVLRVTGLRRDDVIEATSIAAVDAGATAGTVAEPK
jgi:hypothetical protein